MKLGYWTIGSLPELEHLPPKQRKALLQRCVHPGVYLQILVRAVLIGFFWLLVTLLALLTLGWATTGRADSVVNGMPFQWRAAGSAAIVVFFLVFDYQMQLRGIRLQIREAIFRASAGDRLPVCLKCGYDLEGAAGDRCPECGTNINVPDKANKSAHED